MSFFIPGKDVRQYEKLEWNDKRASALITTVNECLEKEHRDVSFTAEFIRGGMPHYFSIRERRYYPHSDQKREEMTGVVFCSESVYYDSDDYKILSEVNEVTTAILDLYVAIDNEHSE